jgi:hypothetical protein
MKPSILLPLVIVCAWLTPGCFIVTDDDRTDGLLRGEMNISWTLLGGFPTATEFVCTPGQTIAVIQKSTDGLELIESCFDCEDGRAIVPPVPRNVYDVKLQYSNLSHLSDCVELGPPELIGESDTVRVDLVDSGATEDFQIDIDGGRFAIAWSFGGGQPLEDGCNGYTAMRFEAETRDLGDNEVLVSEFPCIDGFGETDRLPLATYSLLMDLRDEFGTPVSGAPIIRDNLGLQFGGHSRLVEVTFPLAP